MRLVAAGLCLPLIFVVTPLGSPSVSAGVPKPAAIADTTPTSAAWLARLPDGADKRQFIIDCTNCHQFDTRIALPAAGPRTREQWVEVVRRMLGYAGATTGFPVMSAGRDAERTADWLVRHLGAAPAPEALALPRAARADVREFLFPALQDLPHDVAVDSTGRVVVTGMFSHAMHLLDPASGGWSRVEIPVEKSNPRAVELDRAGNWWVVLGEPNMLARYDGKRWRTWDVGTYAHSVALDSAGGAWLNGHFTRQPELLVQVAADGSVRNHELPLHPTMAVGPGGPVPYELRTGPDGAIWMSELQGNRIVRFNPTTHAAEAFEMPMPGSGPRRFDVDARGILWIPTYGAGTLVRFDPSAPAARRFEEIALPVKDAAPYVTRVHPRTGTVWIGSGTADAVFAYHPRERRFDYYPLPSRGATIRHMAFDPRSSDVWFAYGESPGKNPARIARLRPLAGSASAGQSEGEEIALARGAAPAAITDSADVWVLRDSGFTRVQRGTTGAACLVARPRAGSVVPVCYDPRAARSVMRAELMAHKLRAGGMSPEAADSAVERAFRAGEIERPTSGALAWMMSPKQVFVTPSGQNIGAWRPHVMIYMPSARPDSIGFATVAQGDMFLDKAGEALAHVVVVTAGWADGSRGPE